MLLLPPSTWNIMMMLVINSFFLLSFCWNKKLCQQSPPLTRAPCKPYPSVSKYHSETNKDWHLWHIKHVAVNSPCLTKEPPALHVLMAEQSRPVQPDPAGVSHTSWYWETLPLIQPVTEHNGTKSPRLMCAQWLPRTDGAHSFVMPVSRRKTNV